MSAAHHIKLNSSGCQNVAQQINFYYSLLLGSFGVGWSLMINLVSRISLPVPSPLGREREREGLSVCQGAGGRETLGIRLLDDMKKAVYHFLKSSRAQTEKRMQGRLASAASSYLSPAPSLHS